MWIALLKLCSKITITDDIGKEFQQDNQNANQPPPVSGNCHVASYGYAAITIGTFLEGKIILLLGGFSAHRGFLELPWVIVCAFLGSFLGDQTYFYIGRPRKVISQ